MSPLSAPRVQDDLRQLSRDFRLRLVCKLAGEQGRAVFLVGGCLRDLLANRPVRELDLAVDADPFPFARELARRLRGAFVVLDPDFGIARVIVKGPHGPLQYDLARFKGASIQEDLTLRDCTVNALGIELGAAVEGDSTRLLDPTGGARDIEGRRMRACYPGSFDDDPIRMLRLFRIGAQLEYDLDPAAVDKVRERCGLLDRSAAERITEELLKLLSVARSRPCVEWLARTGLLARVFPALSFEPRIELERLGRLESVLSEPGDEPGDDRLLRYLNEPAVFSTHQREIIKLAATLLDLGCRSVTKGEPSRLKLSARDQQGLTLLIRGAVQAVWGEWSAPPDDLEIYRFYRDFDPHGPGIALLGRSLARPDDLAKLEVLERAFRTRPDMIDPPRLLDGRSVMAHLELPAGPAIGRLLESVREAQVTGRVRDPSQALALVEELARLDGRPEEEPADHDARGPRVGDRAP